MKRATVASDAQCKILKYFNPRPREEGDFLCVKLCTTAHYFNPRPREEGDLLHPQELQPQKGISIHALVKRATGYACGVGEWRVISIHALVKRATGLRGAFFINGDISIHALVKRATKLVPSKPSIIPNFNPRPREEGDKRDMEKFIKRTQFQSTPS